MLTNTNHKGANMNWKNQIYEYSPINQQEIKDKETFQFCMNHFSDILTRNNPIVHITSSAFIVNKKVDHALMVYHNIYNSWSWTGGHVDGEDDFLFVACKEAKEETGITSIEPISSNILSLDALTVLGHFKKGNYVSPHLHLSIAYAFVGDDTEPLIVNKDENSDVKWIPIDKVEEYSTEEHMKVVYKKLISGVNKLLSPADKEKN